MLARVTDLIICGACGRMGNALVEAARNESEMRVVGLVEAPGHPRLGERVEVSGGSVQVTASAPAAPGAVVIDFTVPDATVEHAREAARSGQPMVIGTTGMTEAHQREIDGAARSVPVVQSSNFSIGMNVLWTLVLLAARSLGERADAEIVEAHHAGKVDAPSGTALTTARMIAAARGGAGHQVHGRTGRAPRRAGEIGIHAIRGGDIAGDLTVLFALPGERVELTHRAHGREIYARGALRAARFAAAAKPGLHSMAEVLGLEGPPKG